jgi:hypothetical protein
VRFVDKVTGVLLRAASDTAVAPLGLWLAAVWGALGGLVAVLTNLLFQLTHNGYRWPWHRRRKMLPAYLFVAFGSVLLGAIVAAAASAQISGPWPALIMGATAPSVIRGILGRVEVSESPSRKPQTDTRTVVSQSGFATERLDAEEGTGA